VHLGRIALVRRRSDGGDAFIHDPGGRPIHLRDDLAEILAEEYVASALSGEEVAEDLRGGDFLSEEDGAVRLDSLTDDDVVGEKQPSSRRLHARRK
jgi:hypothetical protein